MIELNLFTLLGVGYLGNMIAYDFTPIQPAKNKVIGKLPFISSTAYKLFNCSKCCATWLGLFFFHDIIIAALAGFTGYLINFVIDYIKEWYQ